MSYSEGIAYYRGEANGDHRVNIKDATYIQNIDNEPDDGKPPSGFLFAVYFFVLG